MVAARMPTAIDSPLTASSATPHAPLMVAARMSTAMDSPLTASSATPHALFDGSGAYADRHLLALDRELRRAARHLDSGGAMSTTSFALHLRSLSQNNDRQPIAVT